MSEGGGGKIRTVVDAPGRGIQVYVPCVQDAVFVVLNLARFEKLANLVGMDVMFPGQFMCSTGVLARHSRQT